MATIALRVQKLDTNNDPTIAIDFIEQEVRGVIPSPIQASRVDRAQSGRPSLYLLGDPWHVIPATIRIHGQDTVGKLGILRGSARGQTKFRVYPFYISAPDVFFDCFLQPEIPLAWTASGQYVVGDEITLTFFECSKDGQLIIEDEVLTG